MHWWQIYNAKWYIVINELTQYKNEQHFLQISWCFSSHLASWEPHMEAKPTSEDWCGASPEVLVKRLIPWRNHPHICYCASRVHVLLKSMEKLFSYLLLCLVLVIPAGHHRPALGDMVTFPVLLFSLGELMRRCNAVLGAVGRRWCRWISEF